MGPREHAITPSDILNLKRSATLGVAARELLKQSACFRRVDQIGNLSDSPQAEGLASKEQHRLDACQPVGIVRGQHADRGRRLGKPTPVGATAGNGSPTARVPCERVRICLARGVMGCRQGTRGARRRGAAHRCRWARARFVPIRRERHPPDWQQSPRTAASSAPGGPRGPNNGNDTTHRCYPTCSASTPSRQGRSASSRSLLRVLLRANQVQRRGLRTAALGIAWPRRAASCRQIAVAIPLELGAWREL